MKKILILTASPRKSGNTNSLVKVFAEELERKSADTDDIAYDMTDLYDLDIKPCLACRCCQTDWGESFCIQEDDLTGTDEKGLFQDILTSDMIVLATPIYAWYCTAPMKALLDRCVYALNKYYDDAAGTHGGERGPALWAGKKVALIMTCGYKPEKGADLLEEGIKRYCKHSQLDYVGSLVERHQGYQTEFMDAAKAEHAKAFAQTILNHL